MKSWLLDILPRNRRLILAEAVIVGASFCFLVVQLLSAPPPVVAAEQPPAAPVSEPPPSLDPEQLVELRRQFPCRPLTAMERVSWMSELGALLAELELELESRRVVPQVPGLPGTRQRLELGLRGRVSAQAQLVRTLLVGELPLALVGFHWTASEGPLRRLLVLTVEMPVLATP